MLKRLFYPIKSNVYLFLICFLALIPFTFLIVGENVLEYIYSGNYAYVDRNLVFNNEDYDIESFSEIEDFEKEDKEKMQSLSRKDIKDYHAVISADLYIKDEENHKHHSNIVISKSRYALEQYSLMHYDENFKIGNDEKLIVSADNELASAGDDIKFANENDFDPKTVILKVDSEREFNMYHSNLIFYVVTDYDDEDALTIEPLLSHTSVNFIYVYDAPVDKSIVNEGAVKLGLSLTCSDYEINLRTSGFEMVFEQTRLVVAIVSVAIAFVLIYALLSKEKKLHQYEKIRQYFYEAKYKSALYHILSSFLMSLFACLACLIVILIASISMNFLKFTFMIDSTIFILFVIQIVLVTIESTIVYLITHYTNLNSD